MYRVRLYAYQGGMFGMSDEEREIYITMPGTREEKKDGKENSRPIKVKRAHTDSPVPEQRKRSSYRYLYSKVCSWIAAA
jgi:hypothetical protein